ncbi:SRPBCC family protein [Tenggerimyces flavus]|uniref:SRPBCC family protein n=1 Tax=Tenggerimyces flavus TaxID=1708749 RepID=A0ABV7YPS2_9ACTN|nr:SRPBCC family protein [Tenggerimyces flavus]MBM7784459.1 hypothetical protein [Tenggerimyces flavus]
MKFTVSIQVALPRERVVQLVADPAHFPKWLRGLVEHEPISGAHGEVGTKSRVVIQTGQQKVEAVETITRREPADLSQLPTETVVQYDRELTVQGMCSVVRDRFTEAGPDQTLWESESEYRFSGLMMRLVGLVMPGAFRKQTEQYMQDFKAFAEQGTDVRDTA